MPDRRVVEGRIRRQPGKGAAVVVGSLGVGVEDFAEAVRAGIRDAGEARLDHHGNRGEDEDRQRHAQNREHRHLDLFGLQFLAEVFGRAPDHQPGDKQRDDREQQNPIKARTHAADDDLAEQHVDQRHHAAQWHVAVVHRIDRAARCIGRDGRPEDRIGDPEADLLTFHIAAHLRRGRGGIDAERGDLRIAGGFRPVGGRHPSKKQQTHGGEDRPTLPLVADHPPEHIGQPDADREDRHHLDQVGKRVGVLVGMGGIGVEEAAAVGAEFLDDLLRGNRALRDHLFTAFERRRLDIGGEVLRHAL